VIPVAELRKPRSFGAYSVMDSTMCVSTGTVELMVSDVPLGSADQFFPTVFWKLEFETESAAQYSARLFVTPLNAASTPAFSVMFPMLPPRLCGGLGRKALATL